MVIAFGKISQEKGEWRVIGRHQEILNRAGKEIFPEKSAFELGINEMMGFLNCEVLC